MELKPEDLERLYGKHFFLVEPPMETQKEASDETDQVKTSAEKEVSKPNSGSPAASSAAGKLTWRPKPDSKVLFILHQSELRNKELTDLLKKIVQSIEIPFEKAGFGIVEGIPDLGQFDGMPNPYGVVFDHVLNPTGDNPVQVEGGDLYFTHRLDELKDNNEYKRALWNHLKHIKQQISH